MFVHCAWVDAVVIGSWCNGQLVVWAFIVILLLSPLWFIWNNSFCQIPARYTSTASNIRNLPINPGVLYIMHTSDTKTWNCYYTKYCISYQCESWDAWSFLSWWCRCRTCPGLWRPSWSYRRRWRCSSCRTSCCRTQETQSCRSRQYRTEQ